MGHLANKVWSLKDFIAAAEHEHSISADTVQLRHTGDFARISVKNHAEVSNILVVAKKRIQKHNIGFAGSNTDYSDKTTTETVKIDSAKDYEVTVKEQFGTEVKGPLGGVTVYTEYVDNVDITLTLKQVNLADGSAAKIGQDPTAPGALINEDILNAVGWILGGLALIMLGYVGYRVWRHYRHGEQLFPRFQAMIKGGD